MKAPLCLIHADVFEPEKDARFREAIRSLGLDENLDIHFQAGDPSEAILKVQNEAKIDLLIAGALETESVHRNFTGNVARELLRRAPCDLILTTNPKEEPNLPTEIVVVLPDLSKWSKHVFHRAVDLAEKQGTRQLTLVYVQTTFAEAKEKALGNTNGAEQVECSLETLVKERAPSSVDLDFHVLRGNTGFTACEFIQSSSADLVVMPSQLFPPDMAPFAPVLDWIIQVIPKNLWVIRQVEDRDQS